MQSNEVVFAGVTSYRGELMTRCLDRPIDESSSKHFVTCRLENLHADEGLDRRNSFRLSLKPERYPFAAIWECQKVIVLFTNDVRIDHFFQTQSRYPCQMCNQLTSMVFRTLKRDAPVGTLSGRTEYLTEQGSCSFLFPPQSHSCLTSLRIPVPVVTICTHVLRRHDEGVLDCFETTGSPKWSGNVTVTLTIAKPNTDTTEDSLTSVHELNTCSA